MKNETVERFCGSLILVNEAEWLKTVFFLLKKTADPQVMICQFFLLISSTKFFLEMFDCILIHSKLNKACSSYHVATNYSISDLQSHSQLRCLSAKVDNTSIALL